MEQADTLQQLRLLYQTTLAEHYPPAEVNAVFQRVAAHLLNYSKIDIHLRSNEPISQTNTQNFLNLLHRLALCEPLQYVLGEEEFFRLRFQVDRRALIPRPETEDLVQWVLDENQQVDSTILDLGTGSGCIAVALAVNLPHAQISACDISEDALQLAQLNAHRHRVKVGFFQFDFGNASGRLPHTYDILVSNPPYVTESERRTMRPNVTEFEPAAALYVPDDDPLVFYRHIVLLARKYLKDGGRLYVEVNERFPAQVAALMAQAGLYSVEVRNDFFGKGRMVRALK